MKKLISLVDKLIDYDNTPLTVFFMLMGIAGIVLLSTYILSLI